MENSTQTQRFIERLLEKTGGWYVIIVLLLAQIIASVTLLLGAVFEQLNAEYSPEIAFLLNRIEVAGIPLAFIALFGVLFYFSRNIRFQLRAWKNNPDIFYKKKNPRAWKDSHSITWKYALSAVVVSFVFLIIPRSATLYLSRLGSQDQVIYSFIAGLIRDLAFIPLSSALFDWFLIPVRKILIPNNFKDQLAWRGNLRLLYKNIALVVISLLLTTLLISSIGYHQTTLVLYREIGSQQVLFDLQLQTLFMGGLAILFASLLATLITRSASNPLRHLLEIFQIVEQGDLSARAAVISSDETGELTIYFNRMIARLEELQSNLEEKVVERTSRLTAVNEVGRVATSILEPDDLLRRVVNLITEEFGYYSAVYLIDPARQWAELRTATGEAGKALVDSKQRLKIDKSNIIGQAISSRQAKVLTTAEDQPVEFNNPLMPYTRSEVSLPLHIGDRILGALDVQSTQEDSFGEDDVETLQNLANQVAISLDNARLFQETRQSLNEMRNIQKQYLRESWIDSKLSKGGLSFVVGDSIAGDDKNLIDIPIALRDQIIGQIRLEGDKNLSPEEETWVQAIATQAALALENARLIEESQGAAIREKFVTEINNKVWASTTIEGVLQTAVRELGQILDATEATIEIDVSGE